MSCTYIPQASHGKPDWLDAMCRNPAYFNPRTLDVHQLITIPAPSRRHQPPRPVVDTGLDISGLTTVPQRPPPVSVTRWVRDNTATWAGSGYEPMHVDDVDMIYDTKVDEDSSDDEDSILGDLDEPLQLEAVPPCPPKGPDDTLFGLHSQLRQAVAAPVRAAPMPQQAQHRELALNQSPQPTSTGLFEETSYPGYIGAQSFSPDSPDHDMSVLTCSSGLGSGTSTSLRELIAHELESAATHWAAACRRLRRRLRR